MPVDPQFKNVLAMMGSMPSLADIPLAMIRATPAPKNPSPTPVHEVTDRTIAGPDGDLTLRIYRPSASATLPMLLFMHGGGFVVGSIETHDEIARALTAETGFVTVSVDYRLAPEHPFPAAPDDCYAALLWAAAHAAEFGADPSRIAVIGDSAGGNLAAVMALRARDENGPKLAAQVLLYPATDTLAPLQPGPDGQYYIISPKDCAFYNRSYLVDDARGANIYASPARAQLHDLPPAYVMTAEYDPLCTQGEAFAAQLKSAGVDTTLVRYDGAVHGFLSFGVPMGRPALVQVANWLKPRLA